MKPLKRGFTRHRANVRGFMVSIDLVHPDSGLRWWQYPRLTLQLGWVLWELVL